VRHGLDQRPHPAGQRDAARRLQAVRLRQGPVLLLLRGLHANQTCNGEDRLSLNRPRTLKPGGTIGVSAIASPADERSEIDRGVRWYEERGYRVKLSPEVYARDDYVAGDAEVRGRELTAMFADPEVDVVHPLTGGYGASQVVPFLDFDTIAANPK